MNTTIPDTQPKGLYLLFFTELWERFGFYTVQTIMILYMTKGLQLPDKEADLLYAAFSALLYLTPTVGGYLADRYLGFQRAIMWGGIMLVVAYALCALPNQTLFFVGLGLLICANGFFKPNVSSIVGELYQENDPRRDGGFTLFYMGINIGALIPPLIAGALVTKFGWHAGFIAAALGMTLGQIIFILGRKQLGNAGRYPRKDGMIRPLTASFYILLVTGILIAVGLCQIAFRYPAETDTLVEIAAVFVVLVVLFFLSKEPPSQQKKMFVSLVLIIISVAFWSVYTQTFTSLMLFADRNMEHHILGIPIDAEATQFFNPFFIIALSPILSRLWIRMDHADINPSIQMKFSLGMLMMSLGLFLLSFGTHFFAVNGVVSSWWLCGSYLLQTIGELLISPIGLAMVTVLCPKHLVGMMMGVWFASYAAAFAIGGMLASIAATPAKLSAVASLPIYSHAFTIYGSITLVMAMISFAIVPLLSKIIRNSNT